MHALRVSTCPTCSSGHQALIAAVLLLAGCAPVVVQAPTAAKPPKAKEGTVVVSVTGNTARVSQFDAINIKQYIKSEPGIAPIKGEYILLQVSEGLARDTSLFVGAALFLYPSRYEGFGLPLLMAMASGVPVLASDAGSIPEVLGDAGVTYPAGDVRALAGRLREAARDPAALQGASERGLRRVRAFSPERFGERMLRVYERAASRPGESA